MERQIAEDAMRIALELGEKLDLLGRTFDGILLESERLEMRQAVGQLIGDMFVRIMAPIIETYRDLDPDL